MKSDSGEKTAGGHSKGFITTWKLHFYKILMQIHSFRLIGTKKPRPFQTCYFLSAIYFSIEILSLL